MFLQACISSPGGQSFLEYDMLLANSVTNEKTSLQYAGHKSEDEIYNVTTFFI